MRRPGLATDRGLAWFILASLLLHGLVFLGSRVGSDKKRTITPAYNVKLVSSRPSGGRGGAPIPGLDATPPPAPSPSQPRAEEPVSKSAPRSTEAKSSPLEKQPRIQTTETKPVPKALVRPQEKPKGKAQEKTSSSPPTAKDKNAKPGKKQDFESALTSVEKLLQGKAGKDAAAKSGAASGTVGGLEFAGGLGGRQAAALAIQIYAGQVQQAIQQHWAVPTSVARAQAVVEIGIKVDARGQILSAWIEQTSGIPIFDGSALRAVRAANPLPAPPMTEGGIFEFYSRFTPRGAASP